MRATARFLGIHLAVALAACASTVATGDAGGDDPSTDVPRAERNGQGSCSALGCPGGERCCLLTGDCFRADEEAAMCPRPPQDSDARRTCASNSQCASGEFCGGDNPALCLGPGHCFRRDNCGFCGGPSCALCACNGRPYPSIQAACFAGVRATAFGRGACGTGESRGTGGPFDARIPCGNDAQCPADQRCCPVTGTCTDRDCPACCRMPPTGTSFPCVTNNHCQSDEYCVGEGCGTPGGCRATVNRSRCDGEISPVCGCDGRDYVNACWAGVSGSRVAATGMCSR